MNKKSVQTDKVMDCLKRYTPMPPYVQKTETEQIIDICLDVCGMYGEDRTRKLIEINRRLGLWEAPPCLNGRR